MRKATGIDRIVRSDYSNTVGEHLKAIGIRGSQLVVRRNNQVFLLCCVLFMGGEIFVDAAFCKS